MSPAGRRVYVTAETTHTVSVIDAASFQGVATVLAGSRPREVAFAPDGTRAYVTAEIGRMVDVIDVAKSQVIGSVRFDGADAKSKGIAVHPGAMGVRRQRRRQRGRSDRRGRGQGDRFRPGGPPAVGDRPHRRRAGALRRQRRLRYRLRDRHGDAQGDRHRRGGKPPLGFCQRPVRGLLVQDLSCSPSISSRLIARRCPSWDSLQSATARAREMTARHIAGTSPVTTYWTLRCREQFTTRHRTSTLLT